MAINTFNLSQEWLPVAVGAGNARVVADTLV